MGKGPWGRDVGYGTFGTCVASKNTLSPPFDFCVNILIQPIIHINLYQWRSFVNA